VNARAAVLLALQLAFLGRVLGQVLVTLVAPGWLPPAEYWYSGLLPYHLLLPAQILLLMFMSLVTYDAWRGDGYWHVTSDRIRRRLRAIAAVYAAAMVVRYALTMLFVPELRWFGHGIPIAFHLVLAGYLYVLSRPAVRSESRGSEPDAAPGSPGRPLIRPAPRNVPG